MVNISNVFMNFLIIPDANDKLFILQNITSALPNHPSYYCSHRISISAKYCYVPTIPFAPVTSIFIMSLPPIVKNDEPGAVSTYAPARH